MSASKSRPRATTQCKNPYCGRVCGKCAPCRRRSEQYTRDYNLALGQGRVAKGGRIIEPVLRDRKPIAGVQEFKSRQQLTAEKVEQASARYEDKARERPEEIHDISTCFNCPLCDRQRARLAAEEKKRLAFAAQMPLPAGQAHFPQYGDPSYEENGADLQLYPIRSQAQLSRKVRAEQDSNPKSLDWKASPDGTWDVYEQLVGMANNALSQGATLARVDTRAMTRVEAQLAWLCRGNAAPLIELDGEGFATLLQDPVSRPKSNYPGCPEEVNPQAGDTFNGKLDELYLAIRSTEWGKQATLREITALINSEMFREVYDLNSYRYASVGAVSKVQQKLKKNDEVNLVRKAVHYREHHQWRLDTPAVYEVVGVQAHPALEEQIGQMVTAMRQAQAEERRRWFEEAA